MKTGAATNPTTVAPVAARRKPQTGKRPRIKAKPPETRNNLAADFTVGALLYSLFASGNIRELLPENEQE